MMIESTLKDSVSCLDGYLDLFELCHPVKPFHLQTAAEAGEDGESAAPSLHRLATVRMP